MTQTAQKKLMIMKTIIISIGFEKLAMRKENNQKFD